MILLTSFLHTQCCAETFSQLISEYTHNVRSFQRLLKFLLRIYSSLSPVLLCGNNRVARRQISGPLRNNRRPIGNARSMKPQRRENNLGIQVARHAIPLIFRGARAGLRLLQQGNFQGPGNGFSPLGAIAGGLGGLGGGMGGVPPSIGGIGTGLGNIGAGLGDIGAGLGDIGAGIGDIDFNFGDFDMGF
ncbi:unnamed protein product [Adineta ricciae]|uniref:Uncharacterized protein n=1 Tax=Adineta ricciae TaxID=249248 RepID=A0A815IGJ2_ADIRI|nr:unnamed protein product [Adineta ricciae]